MRRMIAATSGAGHVSRRGIFLKATAAGVLALAGQALLPLGAARGGRRAAAQAGGGPSYALRGPQVEPEASFWTMEPATLPQVVRMTDLTGIADHPASAGYFPPYPSDAETAAEMEELRALALLRDDPTALAGHEPGRERLPVSTFLQLRPPLTAVYDRTRPDGTPVIRTGRELARYFESETPGLPHRLALEHLLRDQNWSPPRQARMWMALDLAIYNAMLAAWHYKWFSDRPRIGYRPRPVELDPDLSVLYDRALDRTGTVDRATRVFPQPSPGTPRHPAYPSGHSVVGGAGSELLTYFFPDARVELDNLADNCGMARLWAGIHYRSDHLQGLRLGRLAARLVIGQLEAGGVTPTRTLCAIPAGTERELPQNRGAGQGAGGAGTFCDTPPSPAELDGQAAAFRQRVTSP